MAAAWGCRQESKRTDMSDNEHRQIARDSLFVMADLRIDGIEGEQRVRVRNLSSGGMMAECTTIVHRGQLAWVNLRNVGWIEGSVAWVQDGRFGVAFREEIDPMVVRAPLTPGESTPRFVRPPLATTDIGALRKI